MPERTDGRRPVGGAGTALPQASHFVTCRSRHGSKPKLDRWRVEACCAVYTAHRNDPRRPDHCNLVAQARVLLCEHCMLATVQSRWRIWSTQITFFIYKSACKDLVESHARRLALIMIHEAGFGQCRSSKCRRMTEREAATLSHTALIKT